MKYKIPILIMIANLFNSPTYAQIIEDTERPGFVKDSYIITFKPPGKGKSPVVLPPKSKGKRGSVPFGEHSSGQDKAALTAQLKLQGKIVSILEAMNAIHVHMSKEEADKFRYDSKVYSVHQGRLVTTAEVASSWALDRMDNDGSYLNSTYNPSSNIGAGRTIWVLDTGIAYDNATVRSAFKEGNNPSRLFIYDLTSPYATSPPANLSADNYTYLESIGFGLPSSHPSASHGTVVAVAAAGKVNGISYGVATGATVYSVKIATTAPSGGNQNPSLVPVFSDSNTEIAVFNWFGTYGTPGHIVNWSRGVFDESCGFSGTTTGGNIIDPLLESAIIAAHNNGIIIVVAAHNDGCEDNNVLDPNDGHTPTRLGRLDGVLVVGGTSSTGFPNTDELFETTNRRSRTGVDISVFAPAIGVATLDTNGNTIYGQGTSMATAITSGMLAAACSALEQSNPGVYCDVMPPQLQTNNGQPDFSPSSYNGHHPLYQLVRTVGEQDTVRHNGNRVLGYQSIVDTQRQTSRFLDKSTW